MGGIGSGGNRDGGSDASPIDKGPVKPSDLAPAAAVVWDDLRLQIPSGVLRAADCHQLRTLAELIVQSRALSRAAMANPSEPRLTRTWLGVVDQIRKMSMLFGLSPADRQRLKIEPEPPMDEFAELLARRMKPRILN